MIVMVLKNQIIVERFMIAFLQAHGEDPKRFFFTSAKIEGCSVIDPPEVGKAKPVNSFCWKQVRFREPSNPARVLIALVARDPWVIHDIMTGQMKRRTRTAPRLAE